MAELTPLWMADGACGAVDPEKFFPKSSAEKASDPAKAVCAVCAVRLDCLAYALAEDIDAGVWGGLSERSRRKLRRKSHV